MSPIPDINPLGQLYPITAQGDIITPEYIDFIFSEPDKQHGQHHRSSH